MNISFEYTAPGIPQHNSKDVKKISLLYDKIRTILICDRLKYTWKAMILVEDAKTSSDLEIILVLTSTKISSFCSFSDQSAITLIQKPNKFDDMCVVKIMLL